ncbi:MAG TPA: transcriptional regulator, partial [Dehalococcoidia bacterium]|nr:transcriptional regulator [Dehalococcoidia bacterium]
MAAMRLRDRLAQHAVEGFVGRADELAVLLQSLEEDGPAVVAVHGIGGAGKSSLLEAFAARARAGGAAVVRLDCRGIEPTERGFLRELAGAIGSDESTVDEVAERLSGLAGRVVLALDTYEVFRLLDTWLRRVFVPALGANVRVLLVGRESPAAAWLASPGWHGLFRSLPLGPLAEQDALELLRRDGLGERDAVRINRVARGHPLALKLAAAAVAELPGLDIEAGATQRLIEELTHVYLDGVDDPLLRTALEAACVLRRVTVSLLRALLPEAAPQDAFDRLAGLPFVSTDRDGLHIHDTVRETIAAALQSADPSRYRSLCRAAWRQLRSEAREAGASELWRYTADILYLLQNPVVRGAFFPPDPHNLAVEPARPSDEQDMFEIVAAYTGPQMTAWLRRWWKALPEGFFAVRNGAGAVTGLYVLFNAAAAPRHVLANDPVLHGWQRHLRVSPVPAGQQVLFCLGWFSREHGDLPSPEQAAAWLDIKRFYMELRPALRRVYMAVRAL